MGRIFLNKSLTTKYFVSNWQKIVAIVLACMGTVLTELKEELKKTQKTLLHQSKF